MEQGHVCWEDQWIGMLKNTSFKSMEIAHIPLDNRRRKFTSVSMGKPGGLTKSLLRGFRFKMDLHVPFFIGIRKKVE